MWKDCRNSCLIPSKVVHRSAGDWEDNVPPLQLSLARRWGMAVSMSPLKKGLRHRG